MSWLSQLSPSHWRLVNLILVLICGLVLTLWDKAQNVTSETANKIFREHFQKISDEIETYHVNRDSLSTLRDSLTRLESTLVACRSGWQEYRRLLDSLGLPPRDTFNLLAARIKTVTAYDPPISFLIDRGIVDSVRVNQAVVCASGLVGRISVVRVTESEVQLLTDPANRVAAINAAEESRENGIVRYLPTRGLIMTYFPSLGEASPGDTILTSGLGGDYPPDLLIGTVDSVPPSGVLPYKDLLLEPSVDLRSIEEVYIMQPRRDGS